MVHGREAEPDKSKLEALSPPDPTLSVFYQKVLNLTDRVSHLEGPTKAQGEELAKFGKRVEAVSTVVSNAKASLRTASWIVSVLFLGGVGLIGWLIVNWDIIRPALLGQ